MRKIMLFTGFYICLMAPILAQDDNQITQKTLTKEKIEAHIRFLASDELKGRDTPSEGQKTAAKYIADQLKKFGVKPLKEYPDYMQPVSMKTLRKPEQVTLNYNGQKFEVKENLILIDGVTVKMDAPTIYLGYGTEKDFQDADVKGKIVFVKAGVEGEASPQKWFFAGKEKNKMASQKGALALIEIYNNKQINWKLLVNYLHTDRTGLDAQENSASLPHIWFNDPEDAQLTYWEKKPTVNSTLDVKMGAAEKFTVYNVVGVVEGKDKNLSAEYVVYSAHYDHVGIGKPDEKGDSIYNGARDDAVGTATILALAENLAKYPSKRSALFCLFTGEEKGLLGSSWFVEHSPIPLNKMVFCFNSDNAGYNDITVATVIGLSRTTADVSIQKGCEAFSLKAIDDPAPQQNLFDRSDNVSFAKKGIPAPTYSLGLKAFDDEINKYYHQPADQPDNLDYDYLYKFAGAYIYGARLIANAEKAPFWKEGDKYYEAGVKLYEKK